LELENRINVDNVPSIREGNGRIFVGQGILNEIEP